NDRWDENDGHDNGKRPTKERNNRDNDNNTNENVGEKDNDRWDENDNHDNGNRPTNKINNEDEAINDARRREEDDERQKSIQKDEIKITRKYKDSADLDLNKNVGKIYDYDGHMEKCVQNEGDNEEFSCFSVGNAKWSSMKLLNGRVFYWHPKSCKYRIFDFLEGTLIIDVKFNCKDETSSIEMFNNIIISYNFNGENVIFEFDRGVLYLNDEEYSYESETDFVLGAMISRRAKLLVELEIFSIKISIDKLMRFWRIYTERLKPADFGGFCAVTEEDIKAYVSKEHNDDEICIPRLSNLFVYGDNCIIENCKIVQHQCPQESQDSATNRCNYMIAFQDNPFYKNNVRILQKMCSKLLCQENDSKCPIFSLMALENPDNDLQWDAVCESIPKCPRADMSYRNGYPKTCMDFKEKPAKFNYAGCHCINPNHVDHKKNCIPVSSCPCIYNGNSYSVGVSVKIKCVQCTCKERGEWECDKTKEGEGCESYCRIMGFSAPSIKTFDNYRYKIETKACKYVLVKHNDFEISARFDHGNVIDEIIITDHETTVTVTSSGHVRIGEISLSVEDVSAIPYEYKSFVIKQPTNQITTVSYKTIVVAYDTKFQRIYIKASEVLHKKVKGLCGNNNEKVTDDIRLDNSLDGGDEESYVLMYRSQCNLNTVKESIHTLGSKKLPSKSTLAYARSVCKVFKHPVFTNCQKVIEIDEVDETIARCVDKIVENDYKQHARILCALMADFIHEAILNGIKHLDLSEWIYKKILPNEESCSTLPEYECKENEIYFDYSEGQIFTCLGQQFDVVSDNYISVQGCRCGNNYLKDHLSRCKHIKECSCYYPVNIDGSIVYHNSGASIATPSCKKCLCQNGKWDCENCDRCSKNTQLLKKSPLCGKLCRDINSELECPSFVHEKNACGCPEGLYYNDQGKCVEKNKCPCYYSGKAYGPGSIIVKGCLSYKCYDFEWKLMEDTSFHPMQQCNVHGWSITTFDNAHYYLNSICKFVLVKNDDVEIVMQRELCTYHDRPCSIAITIMIDDIEISLHNAKNFISNPEINLLDAKNMFVDVNNIWVVLYSSKFVIHWDRIGARVHVYMPNISMGTTTGLCGDYNGMSMNDFEFNEVSLSVLEYTDKYMLDYQPCQTYSTQNAVTEKCLERNNRKLWAIKVCRIIKLGPEFEECRDVLGATSYMHFYEECLNEACACRTGGACECVCTAISNFASQCSLVGIHVYWRTQHLCPIMCDHCTHYHPCGIQLTCDNYWDMHLYQNSNANGLGIGGNHQHKHHIGIHPHNHNNCSDIPCYAGCFCERDLVLHHGICVNITDCPTSTTTSTTSTTVSTSSTPTTTSTTSPTTSTSTTSTSTTTTTPTTTSSTSTSSTLTTSTTPTTTTTSSTTTTPTTTTTTTTTPTTTSTSTTSSSTSSSTSTTSTTPTTTTTTPTTTTTTPTSTISTSSTSTTTTPTTSTTTTPTTSTTSTSTSTPTTTTTTPTTTSSTTPTTTSTSTTTPSTTTTSTSTTTTPTTSTSTTTPTTTTTTPTTTSTSSTSTTSTTPTTTTPTTTSSTSTTSTTPTTTSTTSTSTTTPTTRTTTTPTTTTSTPTTTSSTSTTTPTTTTTTPTTTTTTPTTTSTTTTTTPTTTIPTSSTSTTSTTPTTTTTTTTTSTPTTTTTTPTTSTTTTPTTSTTTTPTTTTTTTTPTTTTTTPTTTTTTPTTSTTSTTTPTTSTTSTSSTTTPTTTSTSTSSPTTSTSTSTTPSTTIITTLRPITECALYHETVIDKVSGCEYHLGYCYGCCVGYEHTHRVKDITKSHRHNTHHCLTCLVTKTKNINGFKDGKKCSDKWVSALTCACSSCKPCKPLEPWKVTCSKVNESI
ncbi:Ovomucin, beta-subunit, partial [Intoshia linei]